MKTNYPHVFICRFTDRFIQVGRSPSSGKSKGRVDGLQEIKLTPPSGDEQVASGLKSCLAKLGYSGEPVLVVLGRSQATCRYLRVPGASWQELEKIILYQAGRYLPYPEAELACAYQVVTVDQDGFFGLNMTVAHKKAVSRLLGFFDGLHPSRIRVILDAYGLCALYRHSPAQDSSAVLLADIDAGEAELAVCRDGKLFFSSAFKYDAAHAQWEARVNEEITKVREAYLREIPAARSVEKIVILGKSESAEKLSRFLHNACSVKVETYAGEERVSSEFSLAAVAGFCRGVPEDSLDLVPPEIKARRKELAKKHRRIRTAAVLGMAAVIFACAATVHKMNKQRYLSMLTLELRKEAQAAQPLEEKEHRLSLFRSRTMAGPAVTAMVAELHRIIPADVTLSGLSYEDGQLTLRGEASAMDTVLSLEGLFSQSAVFGKFSSKVRYVTRKNTQKGQLLDFELCSLKGKK